MVYYQKFDYLILNSIKTTKMMCNPCNYVKMTFYIPNEIHRSFKKPDDMLDWCEKCDLDRIKEYRFLKHAISTIFEKNCNILQSLKRKTECRKWLDHLPKNKSYSNILCELMTKNYKLKNELANMLMDEETTQIWDNIVIIAPSISNAKKKQLKKIFSLLRPKKISTNILKIILMTMCELLKKITHL